MKAAILILTSLFFFNCAGLEIISEEQRYYEVINDHPLTKDKSFKVLVEWIATNFNSANTVTQLKDQEGGKIILQAIGSYYYDVLKTMLINYRYTLTLTTKDNKIKYNFITNNTVESNHLPQKGDLAKVIENYEKITESITQYLNNYKEDTF